ncbi:MAG TPA: TatD family hydrolase [Phycisphaerae bacterium]|nr:TatD family hydrolase [Phycisphaerae bacterium]
MDYLIDSHCHLTFDGLREQVDAVIERAAAAGVAEIVTVATDLADAEKALALSQQYPSVRAIAGIHPHEASKVREGWDKELLALIKRDDVFAVGEIGLDYHYDFSDPQSQSRIFRRQLEIAAEAAKPVVVHCREAHRDAMAALADFPTLPGVAFHCFSGTAAEADEIWDRGYWISLTGVVTFKRSDGLRAVARLAPADRLMVETDAPYLSPEPLRNIRPNEPAYLIHTVACIAVQRGISSTELASLTTANTRRFFSLPAEQ